MKTYLYTLSLSALSVFLAFSIGAVLLIVADSNPLDAYVALFSGAFGSMGDLARTLEKATPLIFNALAITLAFKAGLFNIGAQGQFLFGAIVSAAAGFYFTHLPMLFHIPLVILAGILAGAFYALIQGILKAYSGAHEVITGIMFNYIAINFTDYLVKGPFMDTSPGNIIPRTPLIQESCQIPQLYDIHAGFFIAVCISVVVYFFMHQTTLGFEIRTVGGGMDAAKYSGINVKRVILIAMFLSGGLAGLGGAVETMGVTYRFQPGFNAGLGFEGIMIALLGKLHPLGIILASLLVGAMKAGAGMMQFAVDVETEIIDVILAILLFFVAADVFFQKIIKGNVFKKDVSLTSSGWGC